MIAEGDKVMCRNIWSWTDSGTKKRMQFRGFVLWRFEGDKIAERWATMTPPAESADRQRSNKTVTRALRRTNQMVSRDRWPIGLGLHAVDAALMLVVVVALVVDRAGSIPSADRA